MPWLLILSFTPLVMVLSQWLFTRWKSRSANQVPRVPGALPFLGHIFSLPQNLAAAWLRIGDEHLFSGAAREVLFLSLDTESEVILRFPARAISQCFNGTNPHQTLFRWAQQHGDIFRFKVLGENIVVLNSADLIREANTGTAVVGRPRIFRIDYGFHYAEDVIFGNYSPKWAAMKKLMVQSLREFGSSHERTEGIVKEEVRSLVEAFRKQNGGAFDPAIIILTSVVNALAASIMGKRYSHDSPEMEAYQRATRLFSEACSPVVGIELDLFPWLRHLPNETFRKLTIARGLLDDWVDAELDKIKQNYNDGPATCILESFLSARSNNNTEHEDTNSRLTLSDEDVRSLFIDLLVSGTFTTSIALNVLCLLLAHNPLLQQEIRTQIKKELGDALPSTKHKEQLPLLEAAILELLRFISHVPLSLPHFTLKETQIAGFTIPKDTQVLLNMWYTHHDDTLWPEPWTFNPYRFLENDRLVSPTHQNRKNLMPFSGGRRACPGDTLAKERIMMFVAAILQNFTLHCDDDAKANADPRNFQLGLILEPRAYTLTAVPI